MSNNEKIVMYSTSWCGDCFRAKRFYNDYGIEFQDIDIEKNPQHVQTVMDLNNGARSVPTIVYPDGSVLVEPSFKELKAKHGV